MTRKLIRLCPIFFVLIFNSLISSGHISTNSLNRYSLDLPDSILVFQNISLERTAQEIFLQDENKGTYHSINNLSFDFANTAIWLRFSITNQLDQDISNFLWISNADIYSIELHAFKNGKLEYSQHAGKKYKLSERSFKNASPLFSISMAPETEMTFLLKVHKLGGAIVLPLQLLSNVDFHHQEKAISNRTLFLFGLQGFAVIFNIFLLIILRKRIYIIYSLYVLFSIMSISGLSGYLNYYIWPEFTWLSTRETVFFNFPGTFFLLLFVQEYLELKKSHPRSNKFIIGTLIALAIGFLSTLVPIEYIGNAVLFSNLSTLWCFVMVIVICLLALKKNPIFATYVLMSYIPILMGVVGFFLRSAGVLNHTSIIVGLDLGLTVQVLALAFALVDRFRRQQLANFEEIQDKNDQLLKLNLAVRETDNAIAYYTRYGDIEWCNNGFENIFGLTFSEIKEEYGAHLTDISLNQRIGEYYRTCSESGESVIFETEYSDNSNNTKWMQTTLTPVLDEYGHICNYITVDSDLTNSKLNDEEKKQLQSQLLQSQKMETVGKLAGGIAHDFNNILTPIIGYTDMAIQDLPEGSQIRNDLSTVLSAAQRAKKLVSQILTFSRHFKEEAQNIKISEIVHEVVALLASSLPTNIKITTTDNTTDDSIFADPTQIQQVVMNLCTNAHQAIGSNHGEIKIVINNLSMYGTIKDPRLNRLVSGNYVHLMIQDTGQGMEDSTLNQLFDPFFTTKEVGKGTGLGLSVVHGIVIKYQGEIIFESKVNKGTTAHVYLPVSSAIIAKEENQGDEFFSEPGTGEKILVVDDEQNISNMLGRVLTKNGFTPTCFTSSKDALFAYAQNPNYFDLIIADQTMPDKTGAELSKEILKVNPSAKIIILTGYSDALNAEIAETIGIKSLLYKPVNMQILINKINSLL